LFASNRFSNFGGGGGGGYFLPGQEPESSIGFSLCNKTV